LPQPSRQAVLVAILPELLDTELILALQPYGNADRSITRDLSRFKAFKEHPCALWNGRIDFQALLDIIKRCESLENPGFLLLEVFMQLLDDITD
jgi:hypothetical protein